MKWFDPSIYKPVGKVFWALTEGRDEQGEKDWVIRKLLNDEQGDYRSLDVASSYRIGDIYWYTKIYAWAALEDLVIPEMEDKAESSGCTNIESIKFDESPMFNADLLKTSMPYIFNDFNAPLVKPCGKTMKFTRPSKEQRIEWATKRISEYKENIKVEEARLKEIQNEI